MTRRSISIERSVCRECGHARGWHGLVGCMAPLFTFPDGESFEGGLAYCFCEELP